MMPNADNFSFKDETKEIDFCNDIDELLAFVSGDNFCPKVTFSDSDSESLSELGETFDDYVKKFSEEIGYNQMSLDEGPLWL